MDRFFFKMCNFGKYIDSFVFDKFIFFGNVLKISQNTCDRINMHFSYINIAIIIVH
jgi:hypothetical protein